MKFLPVILIAALSAPYAYALPEEASKPDAITQLKLPSQAEITEIQTQMPDLNMLMSGMMEMMQDADMQNSMRKSTDAMKDRMSGLDMRPQDNGLPDMNALMGAMLSIMGDEAVMGGLIETLEPLQNNMQALAQDAMPAQAAKPSNLNALPDLPPLPQ